MIKKNFYKMNYTLDRREYKDQETTNFCDLQSPKVTQHATTFFKNHADIQTGSSQNLTPKPSISLQR